MNNQWHQYIINKSRAQNSWSSISYRLLIDHQQNLMNNQLIYSLITHILLIDVIDHRFITSCSAFVPGDPAGCGFRDVPDFLAACWRGRSGC